MRSLNELQAGYIDGEWIETDQALEVIDPATGDAFAKVCVMHRDYIERALIASSAAFQDWKALPAARRGQLLERVADELIARKEMIAHRITMENGKPLAQSRGEVLMAEHHLRWFAEEARRANGRIIPNENSQKRHLIVSTPIGPVGAISPWNFPLTLAVRKVAPALAAGCPVILKPATQTPLSCIALAECMEAAGMPPGVFQLVLGDAPMIAERMLASPLCRKVTFTGSTRVGAELIRGAAQHIKPLSLELGGHAPLLVFDDADLEMAVEQTIIAKFRNSGQSCIAANRIFVQDTIYTEFVDRFVSATRRLKTGPGMEEGVDVGPMISERALNGALHQIEDAMGRGARLLTGGKRLSDYKGYFLEPTVLENVDEQALCMTEESFAPLAPITSFKTEEQAIQMANASAYGLSAYAMTNDLSRMFRLAEQIESGTLGINDGAPTVSYCPFGGVKSSGWGRELGVEGLQAFLETKHVSIGNITPATK